MSHLGVLHGETATVQETPDRSSTDSDHTQRTSQTSTASSEFEISRRQVVVGGGALGMVGLAGCLGTADGDSDEAEIRTVLQTQAEALEDDDLDAYMDAMHPESPVYDETRSATQRSIQNYDLQIEFEIDSIEVDGDTATADVTQETRIDGSDPDFQESRSELAHVLRTYEGDWRVYNSTIRTTEPL